MSEVRYGTVSGFAAAAAEAHRRRTSSARATALAVATVVALVGSASLTGRQGATDRLVPASPSASASAGSAPVRPDPRPAALPTDGAAPTADPTAVPGAYGAVPRVSPGATPRPSPSTRPRYAFSTPIHRTEYAGGLPCLQVDPKACVGTKAPVVVKDRVGLMATFCAPTREAVDLWFAEDVEIEFWVEAQGTDVPYWRSLTDRPANPAPHTVSLRAHWCLEWKTWWFRRGDDGSVAKPGSYDVWFRARSPQMTTQAQVATFYIPES